MPEGRGSSPEALARVLSTLERCRQKEPKVVRGDCASCGKERRLRRGLCAKCYFTPEIREKFATTPSCSFTNIGLGSTSKELGEPTKARPGTEEKLRVLEDRAEKRRVLFHPDDYDPRHEFDPEVGMMARFLKVLNGYEFEYTHPVGV